MPDQFICTSDDVLRMLDALLARDGWWDEFFADRSRPCPFLVEWPDENLAAWFGEGLLAAGRVFDAAFPEQSYDLVYDSGCFHHVPPHRRKDYIELVQRALKPGGHFGLVCFRPEGGSGYTDQQVYQRASLGGGLGYTEDRLRALWDTGPFSLRVLRQMDKAKEPHFGEDFLWVLLAGTHPDRSVQVL